MTEGEINDMNIEVVAVDGVDCIFALFVHRDPEGKGILTKSSANGISREGAIAVLRGYADALETGEATTRDT